jgi:ABC-type transporter Mla subunit MlaD
MMLEKGNVATCWKPNPNDYEAELVTVTNNVSQLQQTASGLTSTVNSHTTQINTASGNISTLQSDVSTLKQTASSLTSTISSHTNSLSNLTDKVNNFKVGGRNLLLGTTTPYTYSNLVMNGSGFTANDCYTMVLPYSGLNLTTNDYITVSFDWSATNCPSSAATWRCGTNADPWEYFGINSLVSGNSSGHYTKTYKVTSALAASNANKFRCRFDKANGMSFKVSNVMLEIASTPSNWVPAVEDTENEIGALSGTVTSHTTSIATLQQTSNSLTSTITSQGTSISSLSGTVTNHTSSLGTLTTNLNTVSGTVNNHTSQITNANTNIGNISGTVQTHTSDISSLKQTTSSLTSTISSQSTSITQLSGTVTSHTSSLSTLSDKMNNFKVGGRNLLLGTSVAKSSGSLTMTSSGYKVFDPYQMVKAYNNLGLTTDDYITLSFDWAFTNAPSGAKWGCGTNLTPYEYIQTLNSVAIASGNSSGHWSKTVKVTTALTACTGNYLRFRFDNANGMTFTISNAMLEIASTPSNWVPAVEDAENEINALSGTVSSHTSSIATLQQTSNSLTSTITSQGTSISSLSGTVNNHTSSLGTLTTNLNTVSGNVNNITVGGRNYIKNSNFAKDGTSWVTGFNNSTSTYTEYLGKRWRVLQTASNKAWSGFNQRVYLPQPVKTGHWQLSADIFYNSTNNCPMWFGVKVYASDNTRIGVDYNIVFTPTTTPTRYTVDIPVPSSASTVIGSAQTWYMEATLMSTNSGYKESSVYSTNWKLECGTKPTEWTPNPDDATTDIATLSGTVSSHTSSIATLQQTSNSLTSTVSGHTTTISNLSTTVNNLEVGGTQILRGINKYSFTSWGAWTGGTWNIGSGGNGSGSTFTLTDSPNPLIKVGWRISGNTSGNRDFSQHAVPYIVGQKYTLSGWARVPSDASYYVATLLIRAWDSTQNKAVMTFSQQIAYRTWTYFS